MIGIYCWTNKINGCQYVGQSIDIEQRKIQHIRNIHTEQSAIHNAMAHYGIENFIFTILEECSAIELDEKERFWINKLDTYKHGYNCNTGGQLSKCGIGEENGRANYTNIEVLNLRIRVYNNHEEPLDIYNNEYKDRGSYDSFWAMIHGDTWKNIDTSMIYKRKPNVIGSKNPKAKLTEEDVISIRQRKYINNERTIDIYNDYKERISFSAFEKIVLGSTWKHIPIPKK